MVQRIIISAALLWGFWGCSTAPQKPANLIPEEQYVRLLIERQLVRTYMEYHKVDSSKVDSLSNAINRQYDITTEQFLKSHHYYQQFPEEQKKRIGRATEQLKQELITQPDSVGSDTSEVSTDSTNTSKKIN